MSLNPNRVRTKELVSLLPGIHLRKLQRLLHASFSTTRYHVDGLERDGEIVRETEGGYTRLYPIGISEADRRTFMSMQSKPALKILRALSERGRLTNSELSKVTKMPRSTLSKQLERLRQAGLVTSSTSLDGQTENGIQDRERLALALSVFERNLLTVATDNFIDLWDI